jgi:acetyltransferase-like isoleucine patch superfamily enzyme
MIRFLLLYLIYLFYKIKNYHKVKYNGFTVIFAFKGSAVEIGKGMVINSSPLSNLLGLYQRTIIVARYMGKITIGENCGISGSTIYAMQEIKIGNNVLVGANELFRTLRFAFCEIIHTFAPKI